MLISYMSYKRYFFIICMITRCVLYGTTLRRLKCTQKNPIYQYSVPTASVHVFLTLI